MLATRLSIPTRTSLQTVWRHVSYDGTVTWQCWTACHDRNAPFHEMLGTHLALHPNGLAQRVTLRPDDSVSVIDVLPKLGDDQ